MANTPLNGFCRQGLLALTIFLPSFAVYAEPEVTPEASTSSLETTLAVDYVSAYVFRGATVNRKSSVQPAFSILVAGRAELGVWGSFPVERQTGELKAEIDVFLRYAIPIGIGDFVIGVIEYTYPEDDIENDRELEFELSFATLLNPSISAFIGIGGGAKNSQYYEIGLNQDIWEIGDLSFNLAGTVGYVSPDEGSEGWNHGLVSLAASYDILSVSSNWVIQTSERVNDLSGQEKNYLSVGLAHSF